MVHYFHSDIAQKYGINAAVLAAFIWECIEGKSIRQPQFFPYLSYDEIRYALKRLIKGRVLVKGHFNESRFDRTNWYAFTEFGQYLMTESEGDYNE